MPLHVISPRTDEDRAAPPEAGDLQFLLHRLNNHLAVVLAHAELVEAKARDASDQARATQIVDATIAALTISRSLAERLTSSSDR